MFPKSSGIGCKANMACFLETLFIAGSLKFGKS